MSFFLDSLPPELSKAVLTLARRAQSAGGKIYVVGGAVRDLIQGVVPIELDLEVFGLSVDEVVRELGRDYTLIRVGRSFPVLKVKNLPIDIALPRIEWKTGDLHTDFSFETNPALEFSAAARRRDFTFNAMGWDPLSDEVVDPYGGQSDLADRVLRPVSEQFGEDALRVLRGMQFIARFDLEPASETIDACRSLVQTHLATERVFEEWKKLLLAGTKPSKGLFFLQAVGWLRFYPELEATVDCPQDPRWHPEGSVWRHTAYCLDAFAQHRLGEEKEDLVVGLAVLCHDLGKPATTTTDPSGAIHSYGHEKAGLEPTRTLLSRLTREKTLIEEVEPLVETHMRPRQLFDHQSGAPAVRRLANKVGRLDRLLRVCRADSAGRPPLPPGDFPEGEWLLERAKELNVTHERPKPLVQGRDLIAIGMQPGPAMGELLQQLFEDQLDGCFSTKEAGLIRARERIDSAEQ
tara:strand:+ start:21668 stop:23056 length:1389 start_codon:yes stop_codon:yes gene_type:complete